MSVRSLGSSGASWPSSADAPFASADATSVGSGFQERNRTLLGILEQRWTIHPSIATLLLVFKSFVGLELARRTTDPKVATLLVKVQDTMTGFVQTFPLVKPGSENNALLLRQVSDLGAAMALDIGDCGKLCQGLYQKSFTGKIFSKATFDGKFRDMGRRLDERRRELDSILLRATSSSLQADVQANVQADVQEELSDFFGSSDIAMGSESSDPPPYTPGDSEGSGLSAFRRDKPERDRQQPAPRAANEERLDGVIDHRQNPSPPPLIAWTEASSPTTDLPPNILENVSAPEDRDAENDINAFLRHQSQRAALLAQGLSPIDLREALQVCEQRICSSLLAILNSRDAKHAVLLLEGARAQAFLDAVQAVLDRGSLPSAERTSQARRLIIRLSEARDQLPTSLFISGVSDHDEHPTFAGGFGDIYRASFGGSMVALKRIRMFHVGSDSTRTRLQFCREAIVWQTLHFKYILPLIGIDRETFPSSFCMVSPWMKNGTVLKYLSEHGRADVEKLLLQIAEGLGYLHSMKIVHGDLRGTNILVSDDWNVCLADFGLTGVIEDVALSATNGALTSSTNHAGSLRWFAPELMAPTFFGRERFVRTPASDVYAYGCVCLELYTGAPPFSEITPDVAAMLRVVAGERPARPEAMSDELWGLVTSAWAQNFQDRPAIDDVIASMKVLVAPKKYKFTLPPIPPPGPDDGLRAIVLYDYEGAMHRQEDIHLKKGEIITQITVLGGDWWIGSGAGGRGLFLASQVKVIDESARQLSSDDGTLDGLCAIALWPYTAETEKELTLVKGDVIKRVNKFYPGWWTGEAPDGKRGMFPAGYVLESLSAQLRPAPKLQPVKPVSTVVDDGLCAISLHDYQALNEAEMNLKKGDLIKQIKPIGDTNRDWLIGVDTDGRRGMFPASCVKPNKRPKIKVITSDGQPVPKLEPLALADRGIVVREHTAGDVDEISLTKGELLTQIQKIYGGWWSGVKSSGKRGLFPSHYVELERSLPTPIVTASDGLCAIAMWDYTAKNKKEQSLAKGDLIKWINKFEEDWWLGVGANGKTGLFPAVYVQPIESQQISPGPSVPMAVALLAPIAGADEGLCGTVLWDYNAEDDKRLSLKKGDLIKRISKFSPGWWMGVGGLKTGLFPAGYVKPITNEHRPSELSPISPANEGPNGKHRILYLDNSPLSPVDGGLERGKHRGLHLDNSPVSPADDGLCVTALWDYVAEDDRELSIAKGDSIKQVTKFDSGWWLGVGPSGKKGLFPAPYVEMVERKT